MKEYDEQRKNMVERQIEARGVSDPRVLEAMASVPRHLFVPEDLLTIAYEDGPLPIGHGQTISQPYIVAFMTEAAKPKPGDKILEIGTGSGYQAAILAKIVKEVYTIEIVEPLAKRAEELLKKQDFKNIHVRTGDGYAGWKEAAPFDAIIVTAAPNKIPQPLIDQLKVGGRLIIPVGEFIQELICITKTKYGTEKESLLPVRFVPMTGKALQE